VGRKGGSQPSCSLRRETQRDTTRTKRRGPERRPGGRGAQAHTLLRPSPSPNGPNLRRPRPQPHRTPAKFADEAHSIPSRPAPALPQTLNDRSPTQLQEPLGTALPPPPDPPKNAPAPTCLHLWHCRSCSPYSFTRAPSSRASRASTAAMSYGWPQPAQRHRSPAWSSGSRHRSRSRHSLQYLGWRGRGWGLGWMFGMGALEVARVWGRCFLCVYVCV
jgi:hypothetical protein